MTGPWDYKKIDKDADRLHKDFMSGASNIRQQIEFWLIWNSDMTVNLTEVENELKSLELYE